MKNKESKFLYVLKRESVSSHISDLKLKKWWIAEAVGVHKTTLRRWLNGEIQRINGANLRKLSLILETPSYELVDLVPLTAALG